MAFILAVVTVPFANCADKTVSLAGEWRFQLDRGDTGVTERWFARDLAERIQLPGALQNQGFGDDIAVDTAWTGGSNSNINAWLHLPKYEKYRQPGNVKIPFFLQPEKHYVGAAWYQRDIEIPAAWKGRRVVLSLERAHWETRLWIDDKAFGSNAGLSTAHVYDLGALLSPGTHRLSIRVDNRLLVDAGVCAHSVSDETQGNWNGIVGELKLATTSPVWIEDAQAYPDVAKKSVLVKVKIGNATAKAGIGMLKIGDISRKVEWNAEGGSAEVEVEVPLGKDAKAWDEFSPTLQTLTVTLDGDDADDERSLVFGLREIGVKDRQFIMNGRPTFFRGTLECCIFPLTGYPPTDVAAWKRIIRICQEHGLNHIRFHSWCPPEAAFAAADELGFYLSVEVAAWTTVGDDQPIDRWLYDEAARILKAYGNHPSFVMMPYGNEPGGANSHKWLGDWVNHWKQADSRRLYTSAAGWPMIPENQYHIMLQSRGPVGWHGLDYQKMLDDGNFPPVNKIDVPVIVHEMGQWCVYPNFDEMKKYTGPLKPKNFEIFRESLGESGMLDQATDFFMASGKLQALCYKEEIEAALRTPGIGGVQLLDLHDFPGQGTALVGVLDPFWDSKPYINAAQYRRFYNSTVPLARLLRRTWTTAETLTAGVEVAHFGAAPLENARPYWKVLAASGHQLGGGEFPVLTVPIGHGAKLGEIRLPLEKLPAPGQYQLVVGLKDTEFENDWNFWVYPARLPSPPADVLVASSFDQAVSKRLAEGGAVFLATQKFGAENPRLSFEPVFWNRFMFTSQSRQTLGLLCDSKHPALAQFPTEYFQDWQWHDIVTGACAVVLDDLPRELRPIVQPIDDWNSNRRLGLIFECRVGKGKLLVCSADLLKDAEKRPAARHLYASLLAYAASKAFDPKVEIPEAGLAAIQPRSRPSALVKLGARVAGFDSEAGSFPVANAIDGDPDTFWHTPWGAQATPMPHHLVIDLGREVELGGINYLPRQDMDSGRLAECEVYTSSDPKAWGSPVATVQWRNNDQWQPLAFKQTVKARYLKVVIKSEVQHRAHAAIAELDIILPTVPPQAAGGNPSATAVLRVADFGAKGDGVHDDGPAITAAFKAAKEDGVPSSVVLEKKVYRLGDNPAAWHYFQMIDHEDLVIDGNGATLLCDQGNLAFFFEGGRDITVRGLTFDTNQPTFTQGEVVAVDGGGTLDVRIMEGYPEPPDEAFLKTNGHQAHGGGGRHMIVFEKGGGRRNTGMGNDHLNIRNITRVSPGVFRFHIKEDYIPQSKGIVPGNWVSYGFNMAELTKQIVAAKDKSASTYAQIAANRVGNITFEKLDFFGSLNGGIRVSDMHGDVTLREVRVIRKPGTRNLLSIPSDALHLMNIRGRLLIENCEIEAPGDDCLNVGTLLERVVTASKDDPRDMTLCTTDNHYYYYTIRKGDSLQFLDTKTKREIGIATVEKVEFDRGRRSHRIVLDRELPDFDPATVLVLNLNQMTSSTVIRKNVMRPFMRNAMLVRAQNMTIETNKLDGTRGGVMGLNFTYSMGESARMRNIQITGNTITGFHSSGILLSNAYRDPEGVLDTRDLAITGNIFQIGSGKTIRIRGVRNPTIGGNRFERNESPVERTEYGIEVFDCVDARIDDK